jgi:preprotein translocase subunit YajC
MFSQPAFAQTAAASGGGSFADILVQIAPLALILVVFYFFLIRPQQQRAKQHQEMVGALKRGDVVVTSGGFIGKIRSVDESEARVELAPNVEVRVIKSMIAEVRTRGEPSPANDSKPS